MNDLVTTLSVPGRPVAVGGVAPTCTDFAERLTGIRHVLVRFTGTRGGTELSFPLDDAGTDLSGADLAAGSGVVHLEGDLSLDFRRVRCVADIDLATLTGTGHLVPVN